MSVNTFVDTNILVYSRDASETKKQPIAFTAIEKLWRERTGRISTQVCNEYYVTVTQKLKPGLSRADAWQDIQSLIAWNPLPIDTKVLTKARECQQKYQLSWWDSLIVSSAYHLNCQILLSEDLNHEQQYFDIKIQNPFL